MADVEQVEDEVVVTLTMVDYEHVDDEVIVVDDKSNQEIVMVVVDNDNESSVENEAMEETMMDNNFEKSLDEILDGLASFRRSLGEDEVVVTLTMVDDEVIVVDDKSSQEIVMIVVDGDNESCVEDEAMEETMMDNHFEKSFDEILDGLASFRRSLVTKGL
ncbi:hypothetical protein R1sor_027086 [Riccia sorocarpa]|uniref:Uncharacterized protein n=1 Tax=Riccia sorocarpa TaxID=122646 RepID=A0ABD3GDY0_9MARC